MDSADVREAAQGSAGVPTRSAAQGSSEGARPPAIGRRLMLDVGILIAASIVIAIVVLATIPNDPDWSSTYVAPVCTSLLALAFSIPVVVAATLVVLRSLRIPTGYRYVFFCVGAISADVALTLATIACLPDSGSADPATQLLLALTSSFGIPWMLITGFMFGVSLPTVPGASNPFRMERRNRRIITFYVLLGLLISISFLMALLLGPLSPTGAPEGDWGAWLLDMVALPAVGYQSTCLIVAVASRFVTLPYVPSRLRPLLVALPLLAWGAFAGCGLMAGVVGLPSEPVWMWLISIVFGLLGIAPGLAIGTMHD